MRIVVFSDTHRHTNGCIRVLQTLPGIDLALHLGDVQKDVDELACIFPELCMESVLGNNDFAARGDYEKILEFEGFRFYLTHGHLYGVKTGLERLCEKAQTICADIALFGHTHQALNQHHGSALLFNPGSSADFAGRGTYGIIEIENGKLRCDIVPLG